MPAFFFTTEELIAFVEAVRADLDAAGHPEPARRLAVVAGAVAMLWIALRKISVCAGCGWRSQRPALAWCPFCGMRRYSGTPGPRLRPVPDTPPSAAAVCPSCGNPPGGRSRYGRPYPSEGQFCGYCGTLLP